MTFESDWIFLKTALPDLQDYVLSSEIYWTLRPLARMPGGVQLAQLTVGNLVLSQARLAALELPPEQAQELAEINRSVSAVREEWRANWGRKAAQEFSSRLNLWQQYLRELRAEAHRSAAIFAREVRQRAILRLLQPELTGELPDNEAQQLAMLDGVLRGVTRPGPFVWDPELTNRFPQSDFWFLYLSVQ